jgi:mono/diheme cytochrome c family protein
MKKKIVILLLPIVVIVGAHYALTLLDNVLKVGRMWETPGVRPHEQPLLVMQPGTVPASGGEALYRSASPASLEMPAGAEQEAGVERGKKGYMTFCAQCHGNHHDGNGTVGQSFAPLPADLRTEKVQALSPGAMFKEISYGIPGGRQPPLATTVELNDRWTIVAYVKSLGVRK